jgi:hypothetical protein
MTASDLKAVAHGRTYTLTAGADVRPGYMAYGEEGVEQNGGRSPDGAGAVVQVSTNVGVLNDGSGGVKGRTGAGESARRSRDS